MKPVLRNKIRFITSASLFDGHDAAIHIMRRILQSEGAEVIHLGHNRSVKEIVDAAIQEDVQGIAISSYQGGHVEFFSYLLELLKERGADNIKVFGGGGGVISPEEIALLHSRGVVRIFSPEDGRKMGLVGMIQFMLAQCDHKSTEPISSLAQPLLSSDHRSIAQAISTLEIAHDDKEYQSARDSLIRQIANKKGRALIIGITGTGGAGKSSLVDEILLRFSSQFPGRSAAILCVDPTKKKTGGSLLGDRIRLNSVRNDNIYVRSMATRRANLATSATVKSALDILAYADFDLVILETAGIGQSDSEVSELSDISVYVMTPEYGAPSQLEKIDMLDFADLVAINKFDRQGSLDALKDVKKAYQRNHGRFAENPDLMPVYGTCAHKFNDLGTNAFFNALFARLAEADKNREWKFDALPEGPSATTALIPSLRSRYLAEIDETIKNYHAKTEKEEKLANRAQACLLASQELADEHSDVAELLKSSFRALKTEMDDSCFAAIHQFDEAQKQYTQDEQSYQVRGRDIVVKNFELSLSNQDIPKVALPSIHSWGDKIRFSMLENLPGFFPFTAGVFPFKRKQEDPTRMFAGEGMPERTNKRFHLLSLNQPAVRLSTAFDSVTLYGADPAVRPDIYGKVGNAGVSVCSLDDAKRLYSGFDLCAGNTSVSMTINGPAPTVLAFFLNAAIDAECERRLKSTGEWQPIEQKIAAWFKERNIEQPHYRAEELPAGHDGMGLGFLGMSADLVVENEFYQKVKSHVLHVVRGTVQADILKEEQAQNTCIFSTEFALKMMADVQEYFIEKSVRNFYSVSISGYHIAEAGANPITQLAFTLANGFTLVEYYRARGMDVNQFSPNLSFFFSNGLDPEYSVIGRVARRIWAIAMRDIYGADDRSQKLKYHIQTSGRSLHAQEMSFNDIRTTLQALYAIADNCNSLHTNAYDEATTTPTEESVRRAVAIQLIINQELGYTKNENPLQGSYFIEQMTKIVEDAVLKEFLSIDMRGGVLGAMETMYQRSKIQEESLVYEHKKHSGELPIVGVNTFLGSEHAAENSGELIRSTADEKNQQVKQVADLNSLFAREKADAIKMVKKAALAHENIFSALMEASKVCSLGTISDCLYDVGGSYRRSI